MNPPSYSYTTRITAFPRRVGVRRACLGSQWICCCINFSWQAGRRPSTCPALMLALPPAAWLFCFGIIHSMSIYRASHKTAVDDSCGPLLTRTCTQRKPPSTQKHVPTSKGSGIPKEDLVGPSKLLQRLSQVQVQVHANRQSALCLAWIIIRNHHG
ncbi:hypothetical protein B0T19DRAFT_169261 [Cercophora scortea]|uniref:Uncharacterized protein n=1 Tax=Cercophora scortea TaxID=314031 RepID=A0AAE0IME4_9PEZI|nr:hypothetical protein B0T19DRAFT_169261 [Cercophora scortea]